MTHHLLCCSDTHGRFPPMATAPPPLAFLYAGDYYDRAQRSTGPKDSAPAEWLTSAAAPVYAVRGNHDQDDPHGFFARSIDAGGAIQQLAPSLFIAGLGWHGERYFELPREIDLERVCDRLRTMAAAKLGPADRLVLLTHYPAEMPAVFSFRPRRSGWWFACVRRLIDNLRPIAVVQGHIHQLEGHSAAYEVEGRSVLIAFPGPRGMKIAIDTEVPSARVIWRG